jgi:hypothetical protein
MRSISAQHWLKTTWIKGVSDGYQRGIEWVSDRYQNVAFSCSEANISPWLRDGVSAFLTLWTPHCPSGHMAHVCKPLPLLGISL